MLQVFYCLLSLQPTEILHEHFVYACDADGRTALITLLYIYKIILQVIALILAFNTRKVKVKGLDDSKYIAAAIYITTIVLPVSFFASLTLWSHVNTFPAVLSTTHLFGATAILILVFVPRVSLIILHVHTASHKVELRGSVPSLKNLVSITVNYYIIHIPLYIAATLFVCGC